MGSYRVLIAAHLMVLLSVLACASGDDPQAASVGSRQTERIVRVVGAWEGPEAAAFREVVAPFEERTGLRVEYVSTRDPLARLDTDRSAGDLPDIVALPSSAALAQLARAGQIIELGSVVDPGSYKRETAPAFIQLGTIDGRLYGVVYKAAVKGVLWYDPAVFAGRDPASWAELERASVLTTRSLASSGTDPIRPWCVALESEESSGWPGTDWIEDFLLRQSGPAAYDALVDGSLPWTSPDIVWAFQSFGLVLDDAGDAADIVTEHFSDAGADLLGEPPRCLFLHQGSFMREFLDGTGGEYDFMPFPDIDPRYAGALIGAGDLLALTSDTPGGRELIAYLVGAEAQRILVNAGGALSGNMTVSDYPDRISERLAGMLARTTTFRFDASDSMSPEMEAAFRQAVIDFATDQDTLDDILHGLEVRRSDPGALG